MRHLLFILSVAVAISASAYSEKFPIGALLNGNDDVQPVLAAEVQDYGRHYNGVREAHSVNDDNSEPLSLDVKVEKAGELKSVLGDNIHKVNVLHVEGPINYDDYNTIWESSFYGKLKEVYLDKAEPETDIIPEDTFFHFEEQVDIAGGYTYSMWLEKLVLPKNIREIGRFAFAYAFDLKEIVFPENLEIIGDAAFTDCKKLSDSKFIFPPKLQEIGYQAFMSCIGLKDTEVVLPETIRVIDGAAFYGTYISKINFPASLEFLGKFAFTMCNLTEAILPDECVLEEENGCQFSSNFKLERVHLPDCSETVPEEIFSGCNNLREANIPKNAKTIGANAFEFCSNLEFVDFPEGLETIGAEAFNRCAAFLTLSFPSTLKTLGASCFSGCNKILEIECKAAVPPVCEFGAASDSPFISINSKIPVYIPLNSAAGYSSAKGWDKFTGLAETDFSGIEDVRIDNAGASAEIYDLSGRRVMRPVHNGLYIRNGKKFIYRD